MPRLHRDSSRSGGSQENRRSLAEILNFDPAEFVDDAAAPKENHANGGDEAHGARYWQQPDSPQAAQSPRALVPTACFPPQENPSVYASYSEMAIPGTWANESDGSIVDLVESFKSLATPQQSARRARSYQTRLSCEVKFESSWPPEGTSQPPEENRELSRRTSFCGATDGQRPRLLRWCGVLPARALDASPPGGFSAKVFMGGLPWDITEEALMYALREFMPVRVEWPGQDAAPRGFAYVTLESERRVRALLHASRRDHGKWIYRIAARNLRTKDAEVIPWAVADSNWVCASLGGGGGGGSGSGSGAGAVRLEPARTVFVGALHGVLSASALAAIMNELFSGVVYAGIDTDKNKYPIGSGRVTFNNAHSYVRAVAAAYVEIRTDKFTKKIQVDPYLEDTICTVCRLRQGPYFCREPVCFRYYCRACWSWRHATEDHKPLMRNCKSSMTFATNGNGNGNGSNGSGSGSNGSGSNFNSGNFNGSNFNSGNFNGGNGNGSSNSYIQAIATPSSSTSGGSGDVAGDEPPAVDWLSLV